MRTDQLFETTNATTRTTNGETTHIANSPAGGEGTDTLAGVEHKTHGAGRSSFHGDHRRCAEEGTEASLKATRKSSKTFENWPVHDCYTRLGRNAIRAGCYSTRCPE